MRYFQTLVRSSRISRCAVAVAAFLLLARFCIADYQKVGTFVIDKRELAGDDGRKGPGVDFMAHWELDKNFDKQSVFKKESLRWLQWLWVNDDVAGVTPP